MRLLLDEMYPQGLAQALRALGIEAATVLEIGLAGTSDPDVFAFAVAGGYVLLTENVGDFARIAAEHVVGGGHHPGVLIALASRFSRRGGGLGAISRAVRAVAEDDLADRLVYLKQQ